MSQLASFIFSSDARLNSPLRRRLNVAVCAIFALVAIDVAINIAFDFPGDPTATPTRLQLYFNYGRSQEGKLRQIVRPAADRSASITLSGWYDPLSVVDLGGPPPARIVTFYGMSHANRLGQALKRVSDEFHIRLVTAPGATSNWAYGAYLRDKITPPGSVAVLAFMSGNLAMINTMSALTWNTNVAIPYTSDRFYLEGGELRRVVPPYASFREFVAAFYSQPLWSTAQSKIKEWDVYYDSIVMHETVLDRSAFVRLLRRAYTQREQRDLRHNVLDRDGVNLRSDEVQVAQAIVREFAAQARERGQLPIIFIANLLGDSNYLLRALEPALRKDAILFLSSDSVASPSDPRRYLPDTHFADKTDEEMARSLIPIIDGNLSQVRRQQLERKQ